VHISGPLQSVDLLPPPRRCYPRKAAHRPVAQSVRAISKGLTVKWRLTKVVFPTPPSPTSSSLNCGTLGSDAETSVCTRKGQTRSVRSLSPVPRASLVPRFSHHGTCTLNSRLQPQTLLHAAARCKGRQDPNLKRKTASPLWGDPTQLWNQGDSPPNPSFAALSQRFFHPPPATNNSGSLKPAAHGRKSRTLRYHRARSGPQQPKPKHPHVVLSPSFSTRIEWVSAKTGHRDLHTIFQRRHPNSS